MLPEYVATGDETISISNDPACYGFTRATMVPTSCTFKGRQADAAVFTVDTDQLRYRVTGNAPTASVGHLVNVNQEKTIYGRKNLLKFLAIRVTTDMSIFVTYYHKST